MHCKIWHSLQPGDTIDLGQHCPWEKKLATVTAQGELTVSSPWPKWSQPAVTELWPVPWLNCDLAVTEPWSYWRCRDWAVTSPWLSYDLAVTSSWLSCDLVMTELWPLLAVTEPWSLGPEPWPPWSPWAHGDNFFLMDGWRTVMACCIRAPGGHWTNVD